LRIVGDNQRNVAYARDHRVVGIRPTLLSPSPGMRVNVSDHRGLGRAAHLPEGTESAKGDASCKALSVEVVVVDDLVGGPAFTGARPLGYQAEDEGA
jgi:hypothetical protein